VAKKIDFEKCTPSLSEERKLGVELVAGVDEVGRGCIAGPVYAAAVLIPSEWLGLTDRALFKKHPELAEIHDSKLITEKNRDRISDWLTTESGVTFAIGTASVQEIEEINILHASLLAMDRALAGLKTNWDHVLVDGNRILPAWQGRATALVKGDRRSLAIAASSIIAKVARDRHMRELDEVHPGYGFSVHKGYGTPLHRSRLLELGPSREHRLLFAPVAAVLNRSPGI